MKYKTIVIDPPWEIQMCHSRSRTRPNQKTKLDYKTMTLDQIKSLDIAQYADVGCHIWLWTTNKFARYSWEIMETWGFTPLQLVTWCKPSGMGTWFASTTQFVLMGYYKKCIFPLGRYKKTHFEAVPKRHSQKPGESIEYICSISPAPRLEIFARDIRLGWDSIGDEVGVKIDL